VITAAIPNQPAEAATSADRAETVVARRVDAKSPRFRFPIAARRVETIAVVRVLTAGPDAADAVTPTPDVVLARADVVTQVSVGQVKATAAVVQRPLAHVKPRPAATTTLTTLIR
jgi:hypothetical protein